MNAAVSPRKPTPPLFLDNEALDRFLAHCSIRRYPSKAAVFEPGDAGNLLLYVIKGKLNIVASSKDGHQLVLNHVNAGDFVGEAGLFVPVATRSVLLTAVEPCEMAEIQCDTLLELMQGPSGPLAEDAAKIMHALGVQLSRRLMETSRKASGLALLDVEGRILRALDDMTHEPGAMTHPRGIQIKTSRQDLARLVGCSREMAGRVIKKLTQDGKMSAHGKTMVIYHRR